MLLESLIKNTKEDIIISGKVDKDIKGIAHDSRDVKEGYIFVCITGVKLDGHKYIDNAIENGAAAIVVEDKQYLPSAVNDNVTYVYSKDTREFLSLLSSNFYGNPSKKLITIGITGTNGKTSCVFMVGSILKACGIKHSVISTVENHIVDEVLPPSNTTPESLVIHNLLAKTVDKGGEYAVIECSSHGIEMKRTAHVYLDYAGFTNITHDHMDKHKTIESYFETKRALTHNLKDSNKLAISTNNDDEYFRTITKGALTYGIENQSDVMAQNIKLEKYYSTFTLATPKGNLDIKFNTPGLHNVYNALNAATLAYIAGIELEYIKKGLESFKNVDGRMDIIENNLGINIIVDFAHNPGGLETILRAAKSLFGGKILSVFGMGLYDDPEKYTLMGSIANKYCEMNIITTDSADGFDPLPIAKQVAGNIDQGKYIIEMDRYKAIQIGLSKCKPGDTLMILGKGHENYIKVNGKKVPFKDSQVARELAMSMEQGK